MMQDIVAVLERVKETKRTVVYKEKDPPMGLERVGNIYISKHFLGGVGPTELELVVRPKA